jgi:hydrogenase-1 operon protein HyaE
MTAALHPLLQRLLSLTRAELLEAQDVEAWAAQPGCAMLVFAEEPERSKETLDLAVIVPELHAAHGAAFRVGLLTPAAARATAPRFGFGRWPGFVLLRDGQYLGAVDGLRDWDDYQGALAALLAAPASRPPGVGIPVRAAATDTHCQSSTR